MRLFQAKYAKGKKQGFRK